MAAGGRKPTFKDFYGEFEDESEDSDSSKGHHSDHRKKTPRGAGTSAGAGPSLPQVRKVTTTSDAISKEVWSHVEWEGGPGPRHYRRSRREAKRMTIETCPDGDKVNRSAQDVLSRPCTVCNWCDQTSAAPLKRCVRCKAVSYCDKDCQRHDFQDHKMFCFQIDRLDIARARVYPAVRFFKDLHHARDYSVLLKKMPTEQQYKDGARCNLLVEVIGKIFHPYRYSCLVRDVAGEMTRVIVHDETNLYSHPSLGPARPGSGSSTLEACLQPGDFLLLLATHWRHFQDGRPGIRINHLESVYVINMADRALPKAYRQSGEEILQKESGSTKAAWDAALFLQRLVAMK